MVKECQDLLGTWTPLASLQILARSQDSVGVRYSVAEAIKVRKTHSKMDSTTSKCLGDPQSIKQGVRLLSGLFVLQTGSHYIAQASLEFIM